MRRKKATSIKNPVLIDAVSKSLQYPATFSVPITNYANKGDFAKIAIEGDPGERFWVEIESRDGDVFIGRIDDDLVTTDALEYNDRVFFHARNIHQIYSLK